MVRRVGERDDAGAGPEAIPVEEPLELRLNGEVVGTTMRTPGHDFELAAGWGLAEGLLADDRVHRIEYCAGTGADGLNTYNVLDVRTVSGRAPAVPGRLTTATASCGVCGSRTVDDLCARLQPLPPATASLGAVQAAVEALPAAQSLFGATGSVHGAATFALADGALGTVREDVGRHNAVDKLLGRLLLDDGLPATGWGLALSGRVSVELVQKAWVGGFGVVAAVGGPSSLAVNTASAARITLVGFVRDGRATVYVGDLAP